MSGHPLRERLRQLFRTPDALSPDETQELTQHLETCATCQESIEEALRDSVVDRCRGVLRRVEQSLRDEPPAGPPPPMPERAPAGECIRFPGPPTAHGPLGSVGHYAIEAEVGSGGFGVVFRAVDEHLGRVVAMKVMRPECALNDVYRARFVNEAQAAASVRQVDHVVQVHEVVVPQEKDEFPYPYLVMEWVEGQTLEDRRTSGKPLSWKDAVRIVREVAEGLTEVHRCITAHRDLKPANIMLVGDTDRAKIMDFGLALPANLAAGERLTQPGILLGTPCYMSPEQILGGDVLDGRSDVFSLGVVLYELLTGRLPFDEKKQFDLLKAILAPNREPVRPRRLNRNLPRDLEIIVCKCLAKDAAERYQTARALADDLCRLEEGRPILARPAPLWEQIWKWARRHKAAAALLVFIFVGAIGAAVAGAIVAQREAKLHEQADKERDRARGLEHAERVERARALARRGLWPDARRAYDEAITSDRPDADSLRVERLRTLFTYEERPNLPNELDRLAHCTDLVPTDAALVLLHRGDYLMSDWQRQKEATALVAQALAVSGGLAHADRAYAEGLIAPTAGAAVERFRTALDLDSFHHRANSALLTAYLFLGRFEDARGRADFMRQTFRDDPLPIFADAWMALLSGDRNACLQHLEPIAKLVGEKRAKALRTFFNVVADLFEIADQIDVENPAGLAFPLFRAAGKVASLSAVYRPALEPFGFGVPTISRLMANMELLRLTLLDFVWERADAAFAKLETANRIHPDGSLLYLQAFAQTKRAFMLQKKDHMAGVRLTVEARDLAYRAADAPTLLPRASFRYEARLLGLGLDYAVSQEPAATDPTRPARIRDQCYQLADQGRRLPQARRRFLAQFIEKNTLDFECARFLLSCWLRDEPDDLTALRLRGRLDLRAGDWSSAKRFADRVLRDRPTDTEMQKVRKDALAGMRKDLE